VDSGHRVVASVLRLVVPRVLPEVLRAKTEAYNAGSWAGVGGNGSRGFLPTDIFIPLPSGNGIPLWYKWYTASYRSNSKSKPKSPIQTVTSGIPQYK
jgi:hypothetical protein